MNLANALTISRMILVVPIAALLYTGDSAARLAALILFVIAVLTDPLDGMIAKKMKMQSNTGIFLDPTADKVLANCLLIVIYDMGFIPLWMVLLNLAREFIVQGFRSIAPCKGIVIKTAMLNKSKLWFQFLTIFIALFLITQTVENETIFLYSSGAMSLALITGYVSMATLIYDNKIIFRKKDIDLPSMYKAGR